MIKLDPKIYDQYVGQYVLELGETFTITRESDKLFVNFAGRPKIQAFPESKEKFFLTPTEALLTFVKDSKGLVAYIEVENEFDSRGQRKRFPKIK